MTEYDDEHIHGRFEAQSRMAHVLPFHTDIDEVSNPELSEPHPRHRLVPGDRQIIDEHIEQEIGVPSQDITGYTVMADEMGLPIGVRVHYMDERGHTRNYLVDGPAFAITNVGKSSLDNTVREGAHRRMFNMPTEEDDVSYDPPVLPKHEAMVEALHEKGRINPAEFKYKE